uniref:RNP-1 like RNA-binding domain protein n=1 Tax=uncultured bacterium CSLC2 TaxID=1091571 RepID=G4WVS4_9BACT|nr:RNP-1 like RNA-binding domain protein [uncultured bacterium CSLC2]
MEKVFISALPFKVTEPELQAYFEPYGQVTSLELHADWEEASFEPYAVVEMENAEDAIKALDGKIIGSTYLRVNKLVVL